MKHFLTFFACILLLSCGSSKRPDYNFVQRDTIVTLVNKNWFNNDFPYLRTAREIKYVNKMVDVDSNTQKRQKALDTTYSVFLIENARDSTGKILKTKNGADSILTGWVPAEKKYIIEVKEYNFQPKKN